MAFCQHCGREVHQDAVVCLHCGRSLQSTYRNSTLSSIRDEGGFLWGLLGFLVPVAGLIIYLVWKEERPNNAKAAGIGALVNVGLSIGVLIIYIIAIIGFVVISGAAFI